MRPTLATTAAGLCIALLLLGGQPQGPTGCLAEIREAWSYVKVREHAYMFWWLMFADTPEYQAAPLIIWLQGASPSMPSSSDEADSDTERADPPSRTTSLKSRNSHIASPGSERPESEEDFPESDNEPVTSSGGRLGSSAGSAMEAPAAAPEAQEQRNSADPSQKFPAREPHAPADEDSPLQDGIASLSDADDSSLFDKDEEEAFSSDHASQQGFPGDFLTLDDDMGGPGASSAGFGNFAEIGPLDVQLLPRNHSWVRFANLLFVDNPVGSGYSFVTNETGFAVNNSQIASDLVTMISVFLAKMPEFQNVPLYIFSESYGGKMAAEFALQLYKAHASGKVLCKLSGVALGDGWLSPLDSTSTWGQYLYTMSFLDKTNLMTLNKVVGEIRQALVAKDGAKATSLWASAEDIVEQLTNGIDWYNILLPQQEQSASLGALSLPSDNTIGRAFVRHVAHFYNIFNGTLTELMNGPIKEKLGSIPKNVTWGGQSGAVFQALKADFMLPAVDAVDRLLNETDVTVAVYSGQLDLIVDALGTLQWMEQLRWPGMKEFQATAKKPMVVEGETAGYYKSFKNLTLYWVLKAGHMVPADAPLAAQSMARHITMGKW